MAGGDLCEKVGRERPLGYFLWFSHRDKLRTVSASASPRAKNKVPKKAVGGAIRAERGLKKRSPRRGRITSFRSQCR